MASSKEQEDRRLSGVEEQSSVLSNEDQSVYSVEGPESSHGKNFNNNSPEEVIAKLTKRIPVESPKFISLPQSIGLEEGEATALEREERRVALRSAAFENIKRLLESRRPKYGVELGGKWREEALQTAEGKKALHEYLAIFTRREEEFRARQKQQNEGLLVDTETLKSFFSTVMNPRGQPVYATDNDLLYYVIPPPGLGGPPRPSLFDTGIYASRLVLDSYQIDKKTSPKLPLSPKGLCYDGRPPIAQGSFEWMYGLPSASGKAKGMKGAKAFHPKTNGASNKGQHGRRFSIPTKLRVFPTNPPPPVNLPANSMNRDVMSAPEDVEVQRARAKLALVLTRCVWGFTPEQLLGIMSIRVPALEEKEKKEASEGRSEGEEPVTYGIVSEDLDLGKKIWSIIDLCEQARI